MIPEDVMRFCGAEIVELVNLVQVSEPSFVLTVYVLGVLRVIPFGTLAVIHPEYGLVAVVEALVVVVVVLVLVVVDVGLLVLWLWAT